MEKLSLIGNLGNDAVIKSSGNNQFVTFNIAVTTRRKNGEQVHENTNWYDCSFDNIKLAEYLKKGTKVYVEGGFKIDFNKWHPKVYVYVNRIELLSSKKEEPRTPSTPPQQEQSIEQSFEAGAKSNEDLPS